MAARALEDYLTGEAHPPLLRATISLAVGAPTAEERERRVEALRREYAPITLERPTGDQLRLFCQHFPGQPTAARGLRGPPARRAARRDGRRPPRTPSAPTAAPTWAGRCRARGRPCASTSPRRAAPRFTPAILLVGPPGRGKTVALQRLLYERFLQGSRIIDVDPKPDHRWTELPGVNAG